METKSKLRKDIDKLFESVAELKKQIANLHDVVFEHQCRLDSLEKAADTISGRECAELLGYASHSVKSEFLKKAGIEFFLDENGRQHISRQSVIAYLAKKEDQNQ